MSGGRGAVNIVLYWDELDISVVEYENSVPVTVEGFNAAVQRIGSCTVRISKDAALHDLVTKLSAELSEPAPGPAPGKPIPTAKPVARSENGPEADRKKSTTGTLVTGEVAHCNGKGAGVDEDEDSPGFCLKDSSDCWLLAVRGSQIQVLWCRVVWCGVVCCGVVWCGVVWCGVVWCGVVWCGVVWCGVVWCGVVWCGVVWCGVVWCAEGAVTKRQKAGMSTHGYR